ncbi:hypothetical protein CcaverHIS002_0411560 [Cutaneotrichosporon cavernicola]|uniref:Uncharacterized protein n=1 Tax=Cutaneotrichosporon cavernicola TaxID=279322 RepID=A0AA48L5F6_9TREE|nr:uncharacterized protein CcaverHIS019_0411490 [Cutaneotrichosporon cavernicola]BEI84552.1 hypothetical protein CcaverHIS002_0411560 [Cutaneotrichosporon cavernicola]BEI92329.1 hypothetical protein CcaverHIS019_0411490 [Cutaneotrichosporon cavernicola]BEJ00099.1 hypothetical protein CcaverHIS631_0411410 [Cutaneotrichosporon cavernicola]BEJ07870.1 hypothetical protein CcaverHIS641_0411390 [Cutaneotrichosporon cavernicola]
MFPLLLEPLAPARPEVAKAAYTACGCVHHRAQPTSTPSSPIPATCSPAERSRLFAEASEARRRHNQCRDWASVVSGAARDAVHFNVVEHESPYSSGQRSLPAFYYDADCPPNKTDVKPRAKWPSIKVEEEEEDYSEEDDDEDEEDDEDDEDEPIGLGIGLGLTLGFQHYRPQDEIPDYHYARVEVLDDKPQRLYVEPHLEGSALRKRRRSLHAAAPVAQRVKLEPLSPPLSSVPAVPSHSHDRRTVRLNRSRESAPRHVHGRHGQERVRPHSSHPTHPNSPHDNARSQPATNTTARADAEHGRAADQDSPDQDSPKRICDPLPSIGGLWCALETRHHSSSHSSSSKAHKGP